jgi:hypothetical protein
MASASIQRRDKAFLIDLGAFISRDKIDILGMADPLKTDRHKQAAVKDHPGPQGIRFGNGQHQGMDGLPEGGIGDRFAFPDPVRKIEFFHRQSTLSDKHHRSE